MNRLVSSALVAVMFLWTSANNSLQGKIIGKVVDIETNKPIEKVLLLDKNNKVIFITEKNGIFDFTPDTNYHYLIKFYKQSYEIKSVLLEEINIDDTLIIKLEPKIVHMPTILVGANLQNKFDEIQSEAYTIKTNEYQQSLGNSLAATLKNQIGMSMSSMGPSPARPVFRGFGGNKIAFLNNGVQVSDMSATSPDHALTIDPISVQKVELVRGPKILLYTSNTFGAAIDAQNSSLLIPEKLCLNTNFFAESVTQGFSGLIQTKIPYKNYAFVGNLAYHNFRDIIIQSKKLENSYKRNYNFNLNALSKTENLLVNLDFLIYQNDYGIPGGFIGAHPQGVDIRIDKNVLSSNLIKHFHKPFLDNVSILLNRNYYHHIELENENSIGNEFLYREYSIKTQFNHNENTLFDVGAYGFGFTNKDFKVGGYVFTPRTVMNSINLFAFEELNYKKFAIQFSLRTDFAKFVPNQRQFMNNIPRARDFWTFSVSGSLLKELNEYFSIGLNLSKSSRIPSIEELYSDGPHLAAYSYEIGNTNLNSENGYGAEIFGYYNNNILTLNFAGYYYYYDYYIIPYNTGKINVQQILPIYQTNGVYALITGLEANFGVVISKHFKFNSNFSLTIGENLSNKSNLPQIPPFKLNLDFKYYSEIISAGIIAEFAASQDKVAEFEEPTKGYQIFNLYIQRIFVFDKSILATILSIDNIFDQIYRNHLSRIKSIYPEPGRNFKLLLKFSI